MNTNNKLRALLKREWAVHALAMFAMAALAAPRIRLFAEHDISQSFIASFLAVGSLVGLLRVFSLRLSARQALHAAVVTDLGYSATGFLLFVDARAFLIANCAMGALQAITASGRSLRLREMLKNRFGEDYDLHETAVTGGTVIEVGCLAGYAVAFVAGAMALRPEYFIMVELCLDLLTVPFYIGMNKRSLALLKKMG